MTRKLIVNGDDFGRTDALTRGIVDAFQRGILTSTSFVAAGPCFDLAVGLAKENPGLGIGVHLVIDEYQPVSDPSRIVTLVQPDGHFFPRAVGLMKLLAGRVKHDHIGWEWRAQIRKVADRGIRIGHLDGHGHCHAAPRIAGLVRELAQEFAIPSVRIPAEPIAYLGSLYQFSIHRYVEKVLLSFACRMSRRRWRGVLSSPVQFHGFTEGGRLDVQSLEMIATSLPPGTSELMAHPGTSNDDRPFNCGYNFRGDLDALTVYSKQDFQDRFGVYLVRHGDEGRYW